VVRDAVVEWGARNFPGRGSFSLPVVAETWDGALNDIDGFHVRFHVKKEHVFPAAHAMCIALSGTTSYCI
jgi:Peptidase family S58